MNDVMKAIKDISVWLVPVGSRITCNPPPMDTDADYLCLLTLKNVERFLAIMALSSWNIGGSLPRNQAILDDNSTNFASFTLSGFNVIATTSTEFFRRFMAASSVTKRLNLMHKPDRIALFQAVLYGNRWGE